ncbi:hypothetical protein FDZ71_07010 [bacterium]|nr:MAG: hypothetical protein FDZ71_07010 [bacterium]
MKALKKILVLTPEYPPRMLGDVSINAHSVSKGMVKDGILTSVVTFDDWRPGETVEEGIRVSRIASPIRTFYSILTWTPLITPEFVRASSKIIRGEGVDLVLSFEWTTGMSAMTLGTIHDLPLVCAYHSVECQRNPFRDSPLSQGIAYLEREVAKASELVVATNEDTAKFLRDEYGISVAKIVVTRLDGDVGSLISFCRQAVEDHEGANA